MKIFGANTHTHRHIGVGVCVTWRCSDTLHSAAVCVNSWTSRPPSFSSWLAQPVHICILFCFDYLFSPLIYDFHHRVE